MKTPQKVQGTVPSLRAIIGEQDTLLAAADLPLHGSASARGRGNAAVNPAQNAWH